MNWVVELVLVLKRTSLIFIGRTFRTLWVDVSDCFLRVAGSVHSALPVRKPASVAAREVTLKVPLTLPRGTSYLAATMVACTASVVASVGYPDVITPS